MFKLMEERINIFVSNLGGTPLKGIKEDFKKGS